jgi:hypothetical protein
LFQADCARRTYSPDSPTFFVSPANSRKVLANFLKRARHQLLIYDPGISDQEMIRILNDRRKSGVEIIGDMDSDLKVPVVKLRNMRLHTRTLFRTAGRLSWAVKACGRQNSIRGARFD